MATGRIESDNTRNLIVKSFFIDGTGTAAITSGGALGTLVDNGGTGDYTITFTNPFAVTPTSILVTPFSDSGSITYRIHSDTNNTRVRVVLSADTKFYLEVTGSRDPQ